MIKGVKGQTIVTIVRKVANGNNDGRLWKVVKNDKFELCNGTYPNQPFQFMISFFCNCSSEFVMNGLKLWNGQPLNQHCEMLQIIEKMCNNMKCCDESMKFVLLIVNISEVTKCCERLRSGTMWENWWQQVYA